MSSLTRVQRDVLDRMEQGWRLRGIVPAALTKDGEAPWPIKFVTLESLERRGLIYGDWIGPAYEYLLTQPPRTPADGGR